MKKLLILSGKGGTGKTTLASALIRLFNTYAFADCDVDAPNLHILNSFQGEKTSSDYIGGKIASVDLSKCVLCEKCLELCQFDAISEDGGKIKINDLSCEGCGLCEYICPVSAISLIDDFTGKLTLIKDERILSTSELKMGKGNSGKLVTKVKQQLFDSIGKYDIKTEKTKYEIPMKKENIKNNGFSSKTNEINDKKSIFDTVILDGAPGVGCPVMASLSGSDLCILVTEPTLSGKNDLERILKTAEMFSVKCCVCINKYDINTEISKSIEKFCIDSHVPFLGNIPYDKKVLQALNCGKSIIEYECPASFAIKDIFKKIKIILGEQNAS